jgi:hypothetical protein
MGKNRLLLVPLQLLLDLHRNTDFTASEPASKRDSDPVTRREPSPLLETGCGSKEVEEVKERTFPQLDAATQAMTQEGQRDRKTRNEEPAQNEPAKCEQAGKPVPSQPTSTSLRQWGEGRIRHPGFAGEDARKR